MGLCNTIRWKTTLALGDNVPRTDKNGSTGFVTAVSRVARAFVRIKLNRRRYARDSASASHAIRRCTGPLRHIHAALRSVKIILQRACSSNSHLEAYSPFGSCDTAQVTTSRMRIIFMKFREISQKYPIVRGMTSYAIIWPAACLLQQKIKGNEEFNYAEALRFSLYGTLYVAPTLYCWLRCASYFWPKTNLKSAITKALVEQVTYSPAAMCSFFFGMNLLELKPVSECIEEVKIKFWPTYKVAICIWPILQTINFVLIPERNRVVYVSICSLVWTCFLAYMKALEGKRKQNELVDMKDINSKIVLESKMQTNEKSMLISLLR